MITPPPAHIANELRSYVRELESVHPNTGFGSRAPRPYEVPGQKCSWSGVCQITGIDVNWDSRFVWRRGATRESDEFVPAVAVSLRLLANLEGDRAHSFETRQYFWPHRIGALPTDEAAWVRRRALEGISVLKGWFKVLLGLSDSDPRLNDPVWCIMNVNAMLENAVASARPVLVRYGYYKTIVPRKSRNGTGADSYEVVNDYIYELLPVA